MSDEAEAGRHALVRKTIEFPAGTDLAADWCEECGRPKMNRLLGIVTGCGTCDEVATRHRCTGRPGITEFDVGESWECRDCGSVWTVTATEEPCGECGHPRLEKGWHSEPGDRIASAPRYRAPQMLRHLANLGRRPVAPSASCYQTASGAAVHVKPGCRCER